MTVTRRVLQEVSQESFRLVPQKDPGCVMITAVAYSIRTAKPMAKCHAQVRERDPLDEITMGELIGKTVRDYMKQDGDLANCRILLTFS